jgi:hypothetical protein
MNGAPAIAIVKLRRIAFIGLTSRSSISLRSAASREMAASKISAVAIFFTRRRAFLVSRR